MPPQLCSRIGCNNYRRIGSIYCSEFCRRKVYRSGDTYKRYCASHPPQRGALVYDPLCADPYKMSAEKAREYLRAGEFYIGTVVVIGDEKKVVE